MEVKCAARQTFQVECLHESIYLSKLIACYEGNESPFELKNSLIVKSVTVSF